MRDIKISSTGKIALFFTDSSDHITGKTGLAPSMQVDKAGGGFGGAGGSIAESANGFYWFTPTSGDTDTLGDLIIRGTAAGADPAERIVNIVTNIESDTYSRIGAPSGASISADVAATATPAEVNTEVADVLKTDTLGEPAVGAPPENASIEEKIQWIYTYLVNKTLLTDALHTLRDFNDNNDISTSVVSNDGTTFTKNRLL